MGAYGGGHQDVDVHRAVSLLGEATGDRYRLIGSLVGGETGAFEVRRADGRPGVLKWEVDADRCERRLTGVRLAGRLRVEASWPVPHQDVFEADGCVLVLQELMAGAPVTHLTHALVDELLALHEARLEMAADEGPSGWATDVIEVLVHGGRGYALHQPLRDHDPRTRRVVERIEEIGRALSAGDLVAGDVVHADLHPGNVLAVDGRLSAVIDLDFACIGDAAFDLTALAVSSFETPADPGVRDRLTEVGIDALPATRRDAYVADLLLRNLDWPIRRDRPAEVELWLEVADRLLPPL